jgi:hypothetical protein
LIIERNPAVVYEKIAFFCAKRKLKQTGEKKENLSKITYTSTGGLCIIKVYQKQEKGADYGTTIR